MPPRARAEKAAAKPATKKPDDDDAFVEAFAEPEEVETSRDEICRLCWPEGWPKDGATAGCEHGSWKR